MPGIFVCTIAMNLFVIKESLSLELIHLCVEPGDRVTHTKSPLALVEEDAGETGSTIEGPLLYTGQAIRLPVIESSCLGTKDPEQAAECLSSAFVFFDLHKPDFLGLQKLGAVRRAIFKKIRREDLEKLEDILRKTKNVHVVHLENFDSQDTMEAALDLVANTCKSLAALRISGLCGTRQGIIKSWPVVESLGHLALERCSLAGSLKDKQLRVLAPYLRSLSIQDVVYSRQYGVMFAEQLGALVNLERLEVCGVRDLSMFCHIGNLKELKYLLFGQMEMVEGSGEKGLATMLPLNEKAGFESKGVILTVDSFLTISWFHKLLMKLNPSIVDMRDIFHVDNEDDARRLLKVVEDSGAEILMSDDVFEELGGEDE